MSGAIVIFAGVFTLFGRQVIPARVDAVQPDSAAAAAGLQPGDVVVAIDGRPIESFSDMQRIVAVNAGRTLTLTIDRGGVRQDVKAVPTLRGFCSGVLGISKSFAPNDMRIQKEPPGAAIVMGAEETYFVIERSLCFLAGANSIFLGEKLLTTANPQPSRDRALFERLGLRAAAE